MDRVLSAGVLGHDHSTKLANGQGHKSGRISNR